MNESDFEKVTLHEPFQLKDRRNPNIHQSIPPCFILSSNTSTTTDFLGLDEKLSGVISKLNLTSRDLPLCSKFFSYAYSCVDFSRTSNPPPLVRKKATRKIIFSTRREKTHA